MTATTRSTSRCRSCDAPIVWSHTSAGKALPLDADPDPSGSIQLRPDGLAITMGPLDAEWSPDQPRYIPHFATCPHADRWRRR